MIKERPRLKTLTALFLPALQPHRHGKTAAKIAGIRGGTGRGLNEHEPDKPQGVRLAPLCPVLRKKMQNMQE